MIMSMMMIIMMMMTMLMMMLMMMMTTTTTLMMMMMTMLELTPNEDCTEQLKYNATRNGKVRNGVSKALPKGLRGRGLFCTQGERIGTTNKNKASCKGDSG